MKRVKGYSNKITLIQNTKGKLVDSFDAMGDVLNDYFQTVFTDTPEYVCSNRSDNSEKITIDRKGIAKLIHELKSGKAPEPDSLKKGASCWFHR